MQVRMVLQHRQCKVGLVHAEHASEQIPEEVHINPGLLASEMTIPAIPYR